MVFILLLFGKLETMLTHVIVLKWKCSLRELIKVLEYILGIYTNKKQMNCDCLCIILIQLWNDTTNHSPFMWICILQPIYMFGIYLNTKQTNCDYFYILGLFQYRYERTMTSHNPFMSMCILQPVTLLALYIVEQTYKVWKISSSTQSICSG